MAPVANFTVDKTTGTAPLTVNFASTSTGDFNTLAWSFTDANNNPVRDQVVTLHMRPVAFSTGSSCIITATYCSEDANGNDSLESNEDGVRIQLHYNLDNISICSSTPAAVSQLGGTKDKNLTPQNSDGGSVPSTVMTDQNGIASFDHTYLKSSAGWVVNMVTATVVSNGTESSKSTIFRLAAAVPDVGPPCNLPASPYQY